MKKILFLQIAFFFSLSGMAQIVNPIKWALSQKKVNNTETDLIFKAVLDPGWHVYGLQIPEGGPIATSFTFKKNKDFVLLGKPTESPKPVSSFDKNFNMSINWHEKEAVFTQRVKLNTAETKITGTYEFMVCNDKNCLPPAENEFSFLVKSAKKVEETTKENIIPAVKDTSKEVINTKQADQNKKVVAPVNSTVHHPVLVSPPVQQSLWAIFVAGFLGGLLALIMPCIFPMLPLTISYFTKKGGNRAKAFKLATIYGLSITAIYVFLGMVISILFGSDALNDLASNGIFNFGFFVLLVVFSISFFGAFEITLPSQWVNKIDQQSDKKGYAGIFFMAFALALVSFSCTGPIIGTLLVQAATSGSRLAPAIGMFGFALALAIPFSVFAAFPSLLKSLPKSGGWLNSVKIILGFLELAFALKFLSNVDLAYHFDLLDREIFLSLWIVIFGLLGLYLLGKLKFSHDNPLLHIPLPRFFLAILVLTFTVYMVPGLWGAPLKGISAWLPPQTTQDFDLYTSALSPANHPTRVEKKYGDKFKAPLNLDVFFDYDQALAYAKQTNKPLLIDFTGHSCVNCRKMEAVVWSNPEVLKRLNNDFVLLSLYVDDKTILPTSEQYVSKFSGRNVKTIGNKWSDLQATRFNTNSQPYYVIINNEEKVLISPQGFNLDTKNYIDFLEGGKLAYNTH
jgi:thiol:disulfide interchange protein